jgi:hypothetical protein
MASARGRKILPRGAMRPSLRPARNPGRDSQIFCTVQGYPFHVSIITRIGDDVSPVGATAH